MDFLLKLLSLPKKGFLWLWHHKRISAGILILLIASIIFWPRPKPVIETQKVARTNLVQTVSVSGNIKAKKFVNLTFAIGGPIVWVGVKKGDTVNAYQTIATLDQRTAQKNLKAALIAYSLQRDTFDQTIYNNNGIPNATQALNYPMQVLLQNNQYNLDQAVNSVELSDLAKQQSVLTTPIAGIVTRADVEYPGPIAIAGSTTWTVTDPTSVVFDMDVDQADIAKIDNGQKVNMVFDAYPDKTISENVTAVDFVSHTTTDGSTAFTVETSLPENSNYFYRSGMSGNADIVYGEKNNVLTVPLSALVNDHYVYVKTQKGFVKKSIVLGAQNDTDSEVVSGLTEGEEIALDPTAAVKQIVK